MGVVGGNLDSRVAEKIHTLYRPIIYRFFTGNLRLIYWSTLEGSNLPGHVSRECNI